MKKLVIAAALLGAAFLDGATLDALAAKVGSQILTVSDVIGEIRRKTPKGVPPQDFPSAYSNAVQALVERKLILKAAADKKMDMQEWMVDNRVREIVKDVFGGDRNKLNAALAESRIPITEWRNTIREDLIVSGMRYQMVEHNVVASPAAMQAEFAANPKLYAEEGKTTVSVILLRPPAADDKSAPSVEKRGADILAKLAKGEDFAELAKANSSDSHAKDGGVWKDVKPEEAFRPEIAAEIAKLKVGEHSKLVNLDGWGFIVRKDAESVEKAKTFAEAYDEIERNVKTRIAEKAYADWIRRLREETLVKVYPLPADQ